MWFKSTVSWGQIGFVVLLLLSLWHLRGLSQRRQRIEPKSVQLETNERIITVDEVDDYRPVKANENSPAERGSARWLAEKLKKKQAEREKAAKNSDDPLWTRLHGKASTTEASTTDSEEDKDNGKAPQKRPAEHTQPSEEQGKPEKKKPHKKGDQHVHEHNHDHSGDNASGEASNAGAEAKPAKPTKPKKPKKNKQTHFPVNSACAREQAEQEAWEKTEKVKQQRSKQKQAEEADHKHDKDEYPQMAQCKDLKDKYNIVPRQSWGSAPADVQKTWSQLFCDDPFSGSKHHAKQTKGHVAASFGGRTMSKTVFSRDLCFKDKPEGVKTIVFLSPMTTAHVSSPVNSIDDIVFWKVLWDSFLKASKKYLTGEEKYWYTFYIGFDDGDPILDDIDAMEQLWGRMKKELQAIGGDVRRIGVRAFRLGDTVHAPSWAVSHLAQAGYDAGTDYFYQCNDDVELISADWEPALIEQLKRTDGFGVTGPQDVSNTRILTQSFTHRTHVEIFDRYFAEPFKNWWSDDWLTEVYGARYTLRGHGIQVRHRTEQVGQRYPVHEAAQQLQTEVQRGKEKIREWLKRKGRDDPI